jgi:hypothetical protein
MSYGCIRILGVLVELHLVFERVDYKTLLLLNENHSGVLFNLA